MDASAPAPSPIVTIFGIRHHGPGCARSLKEALEAMQPDIVLVEGPPDAQDVIPLLADPAMIPPVALLVYAPDAPRFAAYYPFTVFSPEWQALRHALDRRIPARFIDLPQAVYLATLLEAEKSAPSDSAASPETDEQAQPITLTAKEQPQEQPEVTETPELHDDPIGLLAEAAGYRDHEMWWERQVEQRQDATDLFEGIREAMTAVRLTIQTDGKPKQVREAQREAHMRQAIRAARREGFQRIAVVCGAWHAPLLDLDRPQAFSARDDAQMLAGLPRAKVQATWIPWTNSRLSSHSGYGAGVSSPGWYEHLWTAPNRIATRWISRAAQLLREQDLDASPANVIEAVRLADTLAALRDIPMPGLDELREAILTVLCGGDSAPLALIATKLEIGECLGEVPAETPAVPLQRDLDARQRRLRLKPSAEIKTLDLDLREETDRARSHLLHQLALLGIAWGRPLTQGWGGRVVRGTGTFHELWEIQWKVEFAVDLIEANVWGNTVESAATGFLRHAAETAQDLPHLTNLLDGAILANLPEAVAHLLACIGERAAVAADVRHLMEALPPLARVARYGDVRGTRAAGIMPIIDGLFERVIVGLPGACTALDDDAARSMVAAIGSVAESVALLDRADQRGEWLQTLRSLIERDVVNALVRGWSCRLLLEARDLDNDELQCLARIALSPAQQSAQAAAWVEGLLRGSGLLLLQQDGLWSALDRWLRELSADVFVEMLPLLRRAFSGFQPPERRAMGEKVRRLHTASNASHKGKYSASDQIIVERAALVLPILATILGVPYNASVPDVQPVEEGA